MIPRKLRLSGFLSYLEPVEIDFTRFDLACISGANGAGKSSLLDAITWVLFGQARRRDESLINSYADAADVSLDFEYEDGIYRVQRTNQRGKSSVLEFYTQNQDGNWRPLTEHSLRETEARIQQTLSMDYDTFINASFFLQGKADQFAQQRPGDRKRILSSILGLEIWETYREGAAARRKKLENDLTGLESVLDEIESELLQEDERRQRLQSLQETLKQLSAVRQAKENALEQQRRLMASFEEHRRMVEVLARQVEGSRQRIKQRAADLEARQLEYRQYQAQLDSAQEIEADYEQWKSAQRDLEHWNEIAGQFRKQETLRSAPLIEIERERSRLEQERETLEIRKKKILELEQQLPELEIQLGEQSQRIADIVEKLARQAALEEEMKSLQQQQADLTADNRRLRQEMNELRERIERLEHAEGAACPLCGQPLEQDDRLGLIRQLEAEGQEKGDRFRKNQELAREGTQRFQEIESELSDLKKEDAKLRQHQRQLDQLESGKQHILDELAHWQAVEEKRYLEVAQILEQEAFAMEARGKLEKIDLALKEIGYDAAAHDAARTQEQAQRDSQERFRKLEIARASLTPLGREIESLKLQLADAESEAQKSEEEHRLAAEKYQKAMEGLPDIRQVETELFQVQEEENQVRMQVGGAIQSVEVLNTLQDRKKELAQQRDEIMVKITRLKTLERAFGKDGVPALLIEQALPEIESHANEILDRLSAGNMSVRFVTQKDYKDKKRDDKRETLEIEINDAAGARAYELFSGGEAFRVNFAIRLALSRVLARRAGARLQTLVIDEGFGSQDAVGRQRLVEAINLVRPDFKKILVITHLEELKDVFPARVEVEKSGRGSRVSVLV